MRPTILVHLLANRTNILHKKHFKWGISPRHHHHHHHHPPDLHNVHEVQTAVHGPSSNIHPESSQTLTDVTCMISVELQILNCGEMLPAKLIFHIM